MTEPWKVLRSETVLQDRWIHLRADHCVTAGGVEVSPYYVLQNPDWVQIVAVTEADELVLVKEYRHGSGEICLNLPGGLVDKGDLDPMESARRELEEEAGATAESLRHITSLRAEPARAPNFIHVYLAEGLKFGATRHLDDTEEGLSVELVPVEQVMAQLTAGIVPHSAHVASILLALNASGRIQFESKGKLR